MNKKLGNHAQKLWDFLQSRPTETEESEEQLWVQWIEESQQRFQSLDLEDLQQETERLQRLQICRAGRSSSLLRSTQAVQFWNQGQDLLQSWLLEQKSLPSLQDIRTLNGVLLGTGISSWRDSDIYSTCVKHIPSEDVPPLMEAFWPSAVKKAKHPLQESFYCRYFTVSIHPFGDGNGRTSQLLADYFLIKGGFPPQTFLSKGTIVGDPIFKPFFTPHEAFLRFCDSVLNSYRILDCIAPKPSQLN